MCTTLRCNYVYVLINVFQVRIISCCIVLVGAKLNLKEVIFVNLAWLPKATVQVTVVNIVINEIIV